MKNYERFIRRITNNKEKNIALVKKHLGDDSKDLIKCIFMVLKEEKKLFTEKKALLAIEALLECGADVKYSFYAYANDFLQYAYGFDFSEDFLLELTKLAIKYKVDINNTKSMHILFNLTSKAFDDKNILPIYKVLVENGLDIFHTDFNFNTLDKRILINKKIKDSEEVIAEYKKDRKKLYQKKYNEITNKINEIIFDPCMNTNILHALVKKSYDEQLTLDVIKYVLEKGYDPNQLNDDLDNFVLTAIMMEHSHEYIYNLISIAIKYGLNINHSDSIRNTIMHRIIRNMENCYIIPIFELLLANGFNYTLKNKWNESILYCLKIMNKDSILDKDEFIVKYESLFNNKQLTELNNLGKVIEKNDEINNEESNLIFKYSENKSNIIVGKKESGKTTSLNELALYLTNVKHKNVFITSSKEIINNCTSISMVKEVLLDIINNCIKNDLILLIDDFDKLYNFKTTKYLKEELNILLNYYITNDNLEINFTISNSNKDLIYDNILSKCLNITYINNLSNDKIKELIENKIKLLSKEYNLEISSDIFNLIINLLYILSNNINIKNNKDISNILVISNILNNIFIYSKEQSKTYLDINDLIYAIKTNNYLKDEIKDIVINELNNLNKNYNEKNVEILIKKLTK